MKRLLFITCLLFFSCEDLTNNNDEDEIEIVFNLEPRLDQDNNGYYHLELNPTTFQTIHRISGHVSSDGYPVENFWVEWDSNLLWYLGDTLGYIVNQYLNDSGVYVSVDTSYIVGFDGFEVPTSNSMSYSNSSGEINNMIAPVKTMVGDTMRLRYSYINGMDSIMIVLE